MTRDETKKILMVVQSVYPNFNPPDKSIAIDAWQTMLSDYPYQKVEAALKAFVRSDKKGFPPSVGQLIDKMQMIFNTDAELNELAAWGLVLKAIRNSAYNSETEFAKLPPLVQKAVVSPAQLKEWALMEDLDGTGLNVLQSNFMRTYRREEERQKELDKMSPDLLALIEKPAEKVAIEERKTPQIKEEWHEPPADIAEKIRKAKERLYARQHSEGQGDGETKPGEALESQSEPE